MHIKELEEIIFKPASNIMKETGEEVFKRGLVSAVRGRKIENSYHIYGDVISTTNNNGLKTHIMINLLDKKVESVRCGCSDFKELSKTRKLFMCEHLTATGYRFLTQLYKKKKLNEKELSEEKIKKTEVGIGVKVTHKLWKGVTSYELEFRLGLEHKYLISDLRSFIFALDNGKRIYFNNQFIYNPANYKICENDIKIIEFIRDQIHKNDGISSTGRNLIIDPVKLRKFLRCINESKIIFKYKGIEYKTAVFKENLPLSFTLKEKDDHFILTTHKKLPIPLNKNRDVYFLNDDIYLPSKNQIQRYNLLYDKFQAKGKIHYRKTMDNYNKLIYLLNSISTDITISEDVKRFSSNYLSFEFFIYKEENIYCDVYATYYNEKVNILDDSSGKMQLIRDFSKEEKILMKLEYYRFIIKGNRLQFVGGDEELFNLLNDKENILHSLGTVTFHKGLQDIKIYNSKSIEVDFYEDKGYLEFNYSIGGIDPLELDKIIESYKADNRFYKTKDNGFLDFEDEGIVRFLDLIQVLNHEESIKSNCIQVEKNKALYIAEALENRDYKLGKGINLIKDIENKLVQLKSKEITPPKSLKAKLREYQISGFKWFKSLSELGFGGILADEMGLGKTIQTIAFLLSEEKKNSLIVAPTSLIYNWKDEIERFAPDLRIGIIHGSRGEQEKILANLEEYDVILTTYGTLRNNIEKHQDIQFDYCIIDEAQNIKNSAAQVTNAVKKVKAKVRFALTGTPIENNLLELWSIFDFIMPGYLYSKESFCKKFIYDTEFDLENLRVLIRPFILRRTKKEVMEELPDKIEKKILVQMTAAQKSVYSSCIKDVRKKMKNNLNGKIEVFSYLTKLRQICLDPSIIIEDYKGGSGKYKAAMTLVEENIYSGGKTLLFSQFTSVLKKIGEVLEDKEIEYFYLDGSTPSKERVRLVNEFNSSKNVRVFLISLKAGGTGLNLTSANLVIHFDPWWNPAVENQAADRAHRIGQRNVVEVIKLVAKGTIEEKIITLQESKKELINNIITGELKDSSLLNKLSREELVQLFGRD